MNNACRSPLAKIVFQGLHTTVVSALRYGVLLSLFILLSTAAIAFQDQDSDPADSPDAVQRSAEFTAELANSRSRIEELQGTLGPFDPALLEPLAALAELLIESGNFSDAIPLLDQQLQIQRISKGLYSNGQIPVLEKLMNLLVLQKDWEAVGNRLDFLSWIHGRDTQTPVLDQLAGMQRLRNWYLYLLNNDRQESEAQHLVRIRDISERTLEMARSHFEEDDPVLIDYIHDLAQADLYIALAIMLTVDTGPALISLTEGVRGTLPSRTSQLRSVSDYENAYGPRVNTVIERSFRNNMRRHFTAISEIRDYYARIGNKEAEAMALVFMGDSILMRDQYESNPLQFAGQQRGSANMGVAYRYYGEAQELLSSLGISESDISMFFSCPAILPIPKFSSSFSVPSVNCLYATEDTIIELGDAHLLVDSMPSPASVDAQIGVQNPEAEVIVAEVQFSIQSNGQPNRIDVLAIEPDSARNRIRTRAVVERLQFRPTIKDGRPNRSEKVRMRLFLPD